MLQLHYLIKKRRLDDWTLFPKKFVKIMALIFLNCESKFDLTDVPSSIYDRKMDARPFDTIHDILRCLSLAQSLHKGRNAPIWRIGNRGVKRRQWEGTHAFSYAIMSDQSQQRHDLYWKHAERQRSCTEHPRSLQACDWSDWMTHFDVCETP